MRAIRRNAHPSSSSAIGTGCATTAATARDANAALHRVHAATLVIQSRDDNRLPPSNAESVFEGLASTTKELVLTEGAGHVITVDFGHEHVWELTARWLETHLGSGSSRAEELE